MEIDVDTSQAISDLDLRVWNQAVGAVREGKASIEDATQTLWRILMICGILPTKHGCLRVIPTELPPIPPVKPFEDLRAEFRIWFIEHLSKDAGPWGAHEN